MKTATIALVAALAAAPAAAAPNAQLVQSVQNRLDYLGFRHVDADQLSTRQIAALHMELRGRRLSFPAGARYLDTRARVNVILGWDDPVTPAD